MKAANKILKRRKNVTKKKRVNPGFTRNTGLIAIAQGEEKKYFDICDYQASIPLGGNGLGVTDNFIVVPAICRVATGTSPVTRVGRKISVKNLMVRYFYQFYWSTFTGTGVASLYTFNAIPCRIITFIDKQTNGVLVTSNDLLDYTATLASTSTVNNYFLAARNLSNESRFKVLKDEIVMSEPGYGVTSAANIVKPVEHVVAGKYKFNFKDGIPIEYAVDTTTGAVGTIKTNNLYVAIVPMGINFNQVEANLYGNFTTFTRIRFLDN